MKMVTIYIPCTCLFHAFAVAESIVMSGQSVSVKVGKESGQSYVEYLKNS